MSIAIVLILMAIGTVVFHFMSPWWWTPIASNWSYIDDTIILTFWITGVVFIAVVLFMAYCCIRFRYQKNRRAQYKPENAKVEWWLTGLTSVGVVAMLTPGLFVWNQYISVPPGAAEIEVLGQQWQWSFRYPGKDGKLGTSDPRNVNDDNPFGINPKDANGQDDVLVAGEDMHIPMGKPIKILLRSLDVLHDFYVPEFRAKMDIVPGLVSYFWFTPTRTGTFDIMCFELCGVGHYTMRSKVVVETESDYRAWLQKQTTFKQSLVAAARGKQELVDLALNGKPAATGENGTAP
jgi:cytochrome c oxidase subunit 2